MRRAAELFGAGHWKESQALCDAILARDPRHFYALHLLAALAARRGEWEECVLLATRALAVDPDHVEVLGNRGAALRMLDRYDEALADYDLATALAPGAADIFNNRGVALAALNRHREALASYDRALALKPDYARARFNRALSHLVTGDFARGWLDHEARWTGSDTQGPARPFAQPPLADLAAVRGRTVLLHAEQGLGDMIQYVRYAPLLKARGATVILEVHRPLKEMMSGMEGVDGAFALGETLPPFDFHCAAVSLPLLFATRLDSIPAQVPYLHALPDDLQRWSARLAKRTKPRIGLAWSGSTTLRNDRHRSIPLARLAPLLREDCTFIALQKDIRDGDRETLDASGIAHFEKELVDFRDTAALASLMDVVVSVDTSIAHLAGALGKPVWVMLPFSPDWRWLLDREDSPWYPSATLLRQPRIGAWDSVISRVASRIGSLPPCAPE